MGKKPPHVWGVDSVEQLMKDVAREGLVRAQGKPRTDPALRRAEPDVVVARGTCLTYLGRHPDTVDVVLIVEVSDTTYHRDRGKKWDANAQGGIPVYWIVNLVQRRVEVYSDPVPEGYRSRHDYHVGEAIPVLIDGQQLGQIAVDDILPPSQEGPKAEGNGA